MAEKLKIISIVGPESTGKTTLAEQLSKHFNASLVPEFAREYLKRKGRIYDEKDLLTIARNQIESECWITAKSYGLVFCDTDVLVVMVWHQFKYRKRSRELEKMFDGQQERKYLLTYPDLPWESDPLRENPNDLSLIFKMYEDSLKLADADFVVIRGEGEERLRNAVGAVDRLRG